MPPGGSRPRSTSSLRNQATRANTELAQHRRDVARRRTRADEQRGGDLGVGGPARHEEGDLCFTSRQADGSPRRREDVGVGKVRRGGRVPGHPRAPPRKDARGGVRIVEVGHRQLVGCGEARRSLASGGECGELVLWSRRGGGVAEAVGEAEETGRFRSRGTGCHHPEQLQRQCQVELRRKRAEDLECCTELLERIARSGAAERASCPAETCAAARM